MDTALYFPHIRVPETPWFSHVLLYWDRAGAIVPDGAREEFETPYMAELRRAGLLELVPAHIAQNSLRQRRLSEALIEVAGSIQPVREEEPEWARIHMDKLWYDLYSKLADMGLARQVQGARWFDVEKSVAALYMGMLASAYCNEKPGYFPVTDGRQSLSELVGQHEVGAGRPRAFSQAALFGQPEVGAGRPRAFSQAAIQQILPVPSRTVPVRELVHFKEQHADKLRRLRLYLDNRVVQLAGITDLEARIAALDAVAEEVADDIAALSEGMARRQWPRTIFTGVGGIVASGLALTTTALTGGAGLLAGLAIGAGVVQLGVAAYDAVERARAGGPDARSPLAYAALVHRL